MKTFYNVLNPSTSNGALLSKSYNKTYEILETIANNNYQWPSTRQAAVRGTTRVYNIDALTTMSIQVTLLTNMVKTMTTALVTVNKVAEASCVYCGNEHLLTIVLEIQPRSTMWANSTDRTSTIHNQTFTTMDEDNT